MIPPKLPAGVHTRIPGEPGGFRVVVSIYRARRWRREAELLGDEARRKRIRMRKALRRPWVYVPNVVTHKTKSGQGYRGGRVA